MQFAKSRTGRPFARRTRHKMAFACSALVVSNGKLPKILWTADVAVLLDDKFHKGYITIIITAAVSLNIHMKCQKKKKTL